MDERNKLGGCKESFGESAGWLVCKRASASGISALGHLYGRCREKTVRCGADLYSEFGKT